jgi:hypothetical protein
LRNIEKRICVLCVTDQEKHIRQEGHVIFVTAQAVVKSRRKTVKSDLTPLEMAGICTLVAGINFFITLAFIKSIFIQAVRDALKNHKGE